MAVIGGNPIDILNDLINTPNNDWTNGGVKGVDGKKRVVKEINPIRAADINELRDAFVQICHFLSQPINSSTNVRVPYVPRNSVITFGTVGMANFLQNIGGSANINAYDDHNYFDIYPPAGYEMFHLKAAFANLARIDWSNGPVGYAWWKGANNYHKENYPQVIGYQPGNGVTKYYNSFKTDTEKIRFYLACNNAWGGLQKYIAVWSK